MAVTSKYYVITPTGDNLDFLDFGLNYGSVTTTGESIQYNGSAKVDSVFIRPGLSYDLTNTAAGADKIYLTGNLADYTKSVVGSVLTLSRPNEEVKIFTGTTLAFDNLVFANGTVNANTLAVAVAQSQPLPIPDSTEVSGAPKGAAAPGATLNATVQAYSTNPAAANQVGETFASTKPGINLIVNGGAGIDTVYVADGETVNARVLGASTDLVYMRGTWADYTKTKPQNDNVLIFTRSINGVTESVTVTIGTELSHDKLIFADGAVDSYNAGNAIGTNPNVPLLSIPGNEPSTKTPLYNDSEVAAALATIRDAAQNNNATNTIPTSNIYTIAGVSGVTASNLPSINSALNSSAIDGEAANTTAEVQTIVNAYNAILASADGGTNPTTPALTGAQYTAIGVSGVSGVPAEGNALYLLDNVVDGKPMADVDTVPEVQALANAAQHVIDAAGGTPAQIANLTADDLQKLGITGITNDNLPAVVAAIGAVTSDLGVDTKAELQGIATIAENKAKNALDVISAAAEANNATATTPAASVYADAGVTGVTASNLASINSALDTPNVNAEAANTTAEVQAIVNAYNAILASADGGGSTTTPALTGAQYTAIGVSGVSGVAAEGTALYLLDNVVDGKPLADVDTVPKVQALADAARHVIDAAGGTPAQIANLSVDDLQKLGITGVNADNLPAVVAAIGATAPDSLVDTKTELQDIATIAENKAKNALDTISAAAQNDTATSTMPAASVYADAGVTGVTASNLASINSALDTINVNRAATDTTGEVQAIVNAYNAILATANGSVDGTVPPLTGAQYAAIGVVGVTGVPAEGNALYLLDNIVDGKPMADVDTAPEVQALADAANHVIDAAGGTPAQIANLTLADLQKLGITDVTSANLPAVQAAIGATSPDAKIDTKIELQGIVSTVASNLTNALNIISTAAQNNSATTTTPALTVYANAGVTGVTASNLASINSALDTPNVNAEAANTTAEVQTIVDAYNAILASADGGTNPTTPALTGAQYTAIGVEGLSGVPAEGTALYLLDNVVDGKPMGDVDTVPEVQALADAAKRVMDAAGGTPAQIANLSADDLQKLGITGITADNLPAVLAAIGATASDSLVDTKTELQGIASAAETGAADALTRIKTAAQNNTASTGPSPIVLSDYVSAGVTGVASGNLSAINSALDSAYVDSTHADTTAEVQTIVNAYNAILTSADGGTNPTTPALTGAQYTAIGVSGVSGVPAEGTALYLLDNVVDGKPMGDVDTVPEVQALADAAKRVMDAAGGTPAQIANLSADDLQKLGITGITADNLPAVVAAIGAVTSDLGVDTKAELQGIATIAENKAKNALDVISAAAEANNATATTPAASVYADAGVTGVTASNLASINSALDTPNVNAEAANTTAEVQTIVNAYNAILASADGGTNPTTPALTGAQYTAIGVVGVSGVAALGNALHLLDDVVDGKPMASVDTVPEVQALADAANHVIVAAAGTPAQAANVSLADLMLLGVTGATSGNLADIQAAIAATADNGTDVDTQIELLNLANGVINARPTITSALSGVVNLDVTSNLVFGVSQAVKVGTGFIHITDQGGSVASGGTGYHSDSSTNTQTIDVATAVQSGFLTITGTGANTKIIINPKWDLDLSSNYQLSIDDGAFLDATGTHNAGHFNPINFSTVTPGTHATSGSAASEAVASQTMSDTTGALVASKSWLDIQGVSNNTASMTQLGDLSGGSYALVMKNYATTPGGALGDQTDGIYTRDANIGVQNFGNNDIVYFDSQVNNLSQQLFDGRYTLISNGANISGGLVGQNTLVMGLVSDPVQQGSTAMISLGLEGNTANTIYPAVYTLDASTAGWANAWHNASAPLVMG